MDHWSYCQHTLRLVSRTFAQPIEMLREPLQKAVSCGYLLCRIADTIEDTASSDVRDKEDLFCHMLSVLVEQQTAESFSNAFSNLCSDATPDAELTGNLPRVMGVVRRLPPEHQEILQTWVGEMVRGMAVYSHRRPANGVTSLLTLADLERYCYFVAGTVGHLLTELFASALPLSLPTQQVLRSHAEEFGLALQLVNILKDLTDDWERGWCFVPDTLCASEGLVAADLFTPAHRRLAHEVLMPVFERAEVAMEHAFQYCLALPATEIDVRVFCLLPLWLAVATLQHARGNDAQLIPGQPVKISRPEVQWLVGDCLNRASNNDDLRSGMACLRSGAWRYSVDAEAGAATEA